MIGRPTLPISAVVLIVGGAYQASIPKRFKNARFRELWEGCRDRENRFREVLSKMRKDKVADLTDLPKNVTQVKESLYVALRRADLITSEVEATEREMVGKPPVWQASTQDAQSRELYKIADENIAG